MTITIYLPPGAETTISSPQLLNNAIVVLSSYYNVSQAGITTFEWLKRRRDANRRSIDFGRGSSSITDLTSVRLSATLSGDTHPTHNRRLARQMFVQYNGFYTSLGLSSLSVLQGSANRREKPLDEDNNTIARTNCDAWPLFQFIAYFCYVLINS